jgi:hypothetical protein
LISLCDYAWAIAVDCGAKHFPIEVEETYRQIHPRIDLQNRACGFQLAAPYVIIPARVCANLISPAIM